MNEFVLEAKKSRQAVEKKEGETKCKQTVLVTKNNKTLPSK